MQLSTDTLFNDLVYSSKWTPKHRVMVDWSKTGLYDHALSNVSQLVQSVKVDRQLTSNLPEEATLVEGRLSAELTLTLTGVPEGQTLGIDQILSPWRQDSTLFRQSLNGCFITCQVGGTPDDGVDRMPYLFTGKIKGIAIANGLVVIKAYDGSEMFRRPITFPAWAMDGYIKAFYGDNYRWSLNSHWLFDYIFRQSGYYQSPPTPAGAVYSATLHGGYAPEVGWSGTPNGTTAGYAGPLWVRGKFGLAQEGGRGFSALATYLATTAFDFNNVGYAFRGWFRYGIGNKFPGGPAKAVALSFPQATDLGLLLKVTTAGVFSLEVVSSTGTVATFTSPVTPMRRNLILNPSYELDLVGVSSVGGSAGGTPVRVSAGTLPVNGSWFGQVTATSVAQFVNTLHAIDTGTYGFIGYTIGTQYAWSTHLRLRVGSPSATMDARLRVTFFNSGGGTISFTDGPLVNLASAASDAVGWTRCTVTATVPATTARIEFIFFTAVAAVGDIINFDGTMIEAAAVAGTYFDGSTTADDHQWEGFTHNSRSSEVGWHHVGFHWKRGSTNSTCRWQIDAVNSGAQVVSHGALTTVGGSYTLGQVWNWGPLATQCQAFWVSAAEPAWVTAWASQVDIDTGLNELTALPAVTGETAWDLLKEVAAAEYGVVGVDETGRPFFKNRDTVRVTQYLPAKVLTPESDLFNLTVSMDAAAIRNVVTYKATPAYLSTLDTVYEALVVGQYDTDGGTVLVRTIQLDSQVVNLVEDGEIARVDSVNWADTVHHGYSVINLVTLAEVTANVHVYFSRKSISTVEITVVNNNSFAIRLSTLTNQPALRIGGNRVVDFPTETGSVSDAGSIASDGYQTLALPDNRWRNLVSAVSQVASSLLTDLRKPLAKLNDITLRGDPRLQVRDVYEIQDPGGLGTPIRVVALSVSISLSKSGLVSTVGVKAFSAPGVWVLGDPTYSVLGSTTYLA